MWILVPLPQGGPRKKLELNVRFFWTRLYLRHCTLKSTFNPCKITQQKPGFKRKHTPSKSSNADSCQSFGEQNKHLLTSALWNSGPINVEFHLSLKFLVAICSDEFWVKLHGKPGKGHQRSWWIGHTFLWVKWKVRYGQKSPRDLLRTKGASPGLKLVSPGRRTCKLDRPELPQAHGSFP